MAHRARWVGPILILVTALSVGCDRSRSPQTLEESIAVRDHEATLRFCEYYFAQLPAHDPDPAHTELVRRAYRKAFVLWSLGRSGPLTRSAGIRIERFRLYGMSSPGKGK